MPDFEYNLDTCNADGVVGWVLHPSGIASVAVLLRDRPVGQARWGEPRNDVAAARPDFPDSLHSGFVASIPSGTFTMARPQELVVQFTAGDESVHQVARQIWPVRISAGNPVRPGFSPALLPTDVIAALCELNPDIYEPSMSWGPDRMARAVEDIAQILRDRAPVKPVLRYAQYLQSMSECFEFIGSHFDRINPLVPSSAKDFEAVASSPREMLCIAHHLYVLRSRGVEGGLVECGCFKGFSTCCLSHACAWLGIPLHVFDSFEGLPPSPGGYYQEGDFRGTLEEVTDNLKAFGQPRVVQLHQGFFADTLPHFSDRFSCIWMDVDLESSSKDVMRLLPTLPSESCVFSHECPPETFVESRPQPDASEVLPPIIDAYRDLGMDPVGRHLTGFLGAMWSEKGAAPVLGYAEIAAIVAAAKAEIGLQSTGFASATSNRVTAPSPPEMRD